MSTRRAPSQRYCPRRDDHSAHNWGTSQTRTTVHRCPGRFTPMNHRAPHASPAVPVDPFHGIDDED